MKKNTLSSKTDRLAQRDNHSPCDSQAQDLQFVRRLQAGDHDALTLLFEKYSNMVFSIAQRILHDAGEAEEVVQQVFLNVYRAIGQYDERRGTVKTWLFQYTYHRTLSRKKHLATKGFYSRNGLAEDQLAMQAIFQGGYSSPFCSHEITQIIEQALSAIQPRQRAAIELTFFEGLTAAEISARTGETVAVVQHNLYRGLSRLRALLLNDKTCIKAADKQKIEGVLFRDPARSL